MGHRVLHVQDGAVDQVIEVPDAYPLACVLGGPDHRTLFVCTSGQHHKPTRTPEPTGQVRTFEAEAPGAGRP